MERENKNHIRSLVLREREMSVSEREWKFRLRGYGYGLRETDRGPMVTSLIGGGDLCTLGAAA